MMKPSLRRIRSTDLTVLRQIIMDELDPHEIEKLFEQDKKDENLENNNVNANEKENAILDSKISEKKHKVRESKKRPPFLLTSVNTKHSMYNKDQIEMVSDGLNKSGRLEAYNSIHYKDIIGKEEKLSQHFYKLHDNLENQILNQTTKLCENSMREARQMLQNSVAVSRMISGLIEDSNIPIELPKSASPRFKLSQQFHQPIWNALESQVQTNLNPSLDTKEAHVFSYSAEYDLKPATGRTTKRTEHHLDESQPYLKQWIERKRVQDQIARDEKQHEEYVKRSIAISAEDVRLRRQQMSKEAFKLWKQRKDEEQLVPDESAPEDEDPLFIPDNFPNPHISTLLTDKQHQPLHNYVYHRPRFVVPRPKTVASFNIRNNLDITIVGERAHLQVNEKPEVHSTSNNIHSIIKSHRPQTSYRKYKDTWTNDTNINTNNTVRIEQDRKLSLNKLPNSSQRRTSKSKRRKRSKSAKISTQQVQDSFQGNVSQESEYDEINDLNLKYEQEVSRTCCSEQEVPKLEQEVPNLEQEVSNIEQEVPNKENGTGLDEVKSVETIHDNKSDFEQYFCHSELDIESIPEENFECQRLDTDNEVAEH